MTTCTCTDPGCGRARGIKRCRDGVPWQRACAPSRWRPSRKRSPSLENQRPWIGSYEHWRKLGYPVGSGMIERALALVINRRMKKRGMRWCRPNATAVVALRTDLLNDDWILPQRLRAFP
jgi:hypothetical protein